MTRLVICRTRIRHLTWRMSIKVAFSLRLEMKSRRRSNDMTPLCKQKPSGLRRFQATASRHSRRARCINTCQSAAPSWVPPSHCRVRGRHECHRFPDFCPSVLELVAVHSFEPAGQRRHPGDNVDATRRAQIVGRTRTGGNTNHRDAGVASSLGIDRHVANE